MRVLPVACLLTAAILLCLACSAQQRVVRSSSLEFLYPEGTEPIPAADVKLELPVRVGLAFAPGTSASDRRVQREPITEDRRQALLQSIADAFQNREVIGSLEVIPSTYLTPSGGFKNLDRLKAAFGVDLIVLLSYEQTQFTESTGSSIAYWTILGAYLVKGEKNETRTILEAVVYDIPSRALLFRAGGSSGSKGRATPVGTQRTLRLDAEAGFEAATEDLVQNLAEALDAFEAQASGGTVRGVGTPEISLVDSSPGAPVGGGSYGGAYGALELILVSTLAVTALTAARTRRRR
jgi:rhombotail lipoprotein